MSLNTSRFRKNWNLSVHECHSHLPTRGGFHQEDLIPHQDTSCVSLHPTPGKVFFSIRKLAKLRTPTLHVAPWCISRQKWWQISWWENQIHVTHRCLKQDRVVSNRQIALFTDNDKVTFASDNGQEVNLGFKSRNISEVNANIWTKTS